MNTPRWWSLIGTLAAFASLFHASPSPAQTLSAAPAPVGIACANQNSIPTPTPGFFFYVQCNNLGQLVTSSTGSSGAPTGSLVSGKVGATSTITTSTSTALVGEDASHTNIDVYNPGPATVHVTLSSGAGTATATDTPIASGSHGIFNTNGTLTNINALTEGAGSSQTLVATAGSGNPLGWGGGSSGSGGSVTISGPLGTQTIGASVAINPATAAIFEVSPTSAANTSGNPFFTQNTAGSAIMGKVGVDQTTPGTTNGVSIAQVGATTVGTYGSAPGAVPAIPTNSNCTNCVTGYSAGGSVVSGTILQMGGTVGSVVQPWPLDPTTFYGQVDCKAGCSGSGTAKKFSVSVTTAATRTYAANQAISGNASGTAGTGYTAIAVAGSNGGSVQLGTAGLKIQVGTSGLNGSIWIWPQLPGTTPCNDGTAYSPTNAEMTAGDPIIVSYLVAAPTGGAGTTAIQNVSVPIYDAITNTDGTPGKNIYICAVNGTVGFTTTSTTNTITENVTVLSAN